MEATAKKATFQKYSWPTRIQVWNGWGKIPAHWICAHKFQFKLKKIL